MTKGNFGPARFIDDELMQKTPRERSIEHEKKIVILITGFLISAQLIILLIRLLTGQPIPVIELIRFVVTTATSAFLYQGQDWAKLLLALGTGWGTIVGIYTLYLMINPAVTFSAFLFILLLTIFTGMSAFYLIFSSDVDEFLQNKRTP